MLILAPPTGHANVSPPSSGDPSRRSPFGEISCRIAGHAVDHPPLAWPPTRRPRRHEGRAWSRWAWVFGMDGHRWHWQGGASGSAVGFGWVVDRMRWDERGRAMLGFAWVALGCFGLLFAGAIGVVFLGCSSQCLRQLPTLPPTWLTESPPVCHVCCATRESRMVSSLLQAGFSLHDAGDVVSPVPRQEPPKDATPDSADCAVGMWCPRIWSLWGLAGALDLCRECSCGCGGDVQRCRVAVAVVPGFDPEMTSPPRSGISLFPPRRPRRPARDD